MSPPRRVLIVEDEMLIAMLLEGVVEDHGLGVVGPVNEVDKAVALAQTEDIALALLDVNLGGRYSYPVAECLRERGIPYAFLTGYGEKGVAPEHQHAPVLTKPFKLDDLTRLIDRLLGL